ncbi:MAG: hypothetical protein LBL83_10900 [Clostridiales bacterium]|jgi:hypothetical protein|nr:hypothetical protein [Clostridiales bacterium]
MTKLTRDETALLRQLGETYMRHASLPVQREKLRLWKAHNRKAGERPMVVLDQLPWHELEAAAPDALRLQIGDRYWRGVERGLRQQIYQWENFPADMVLEPFIAVPAAIGKSGFGVDLDEDKIVKVQNETASSHFYKPVIKEPEDLAKIHDVHFTRDDAQSAENLQEARRVFDGIAPVCLTHGEQFHLGAWDSLATWLGVENVYFDLLDRPEFLHAAIRRTTDAILSGIDDTERLEVCDDVAKTCHCSYAYTDDFLPDFGQGKGAKPQNSWAYGLAQLFSSVAPDVTREFELPYICEMAARFGRIYYGCCERLDDRLDLVAQIPNVQKVSCSPWNDRELFCGRLPKSLIVSFKPNPANLAGVSPNEDAARADVLQSLAAARENGLSAELILKDVSTVGGEPGRLARWADMAVRAAEGVA